MKQKKFPAAQLAEAFAPIDRQFANLLARLSAASPEVKLAAAMVSQQCRLGHICVDLDEYETKPPPMELAVALGATGWPKKSVLLQRLKKSPVVGAPGEFKPLILDAQNRLYLQRYWQYESELAAAILRLATGKIPSLDAQKLSAGLRRLFPAADEKKINWQLVAAFAALRRRLCLISGGPGTGKTRTVVVLLTLLLEQNPALKIALAAPTGKAAARLQDAVKNALATLACEPAIKDRLPATASTLHRLLGSIPDSANFRHTAENPLPFDAVVVDEASMVDLALMAKLVAAIPLTGRLILLGDKDQLASVEAGAVLADLCNGGEPRQFSAAFDKEFKTVSGQTLPAESGITSELADCIVELQRNYRFGDRSGIYQISCAVNAGDSEKALAILQASGNSPGGQVSWKTLPPPAALKTTLKPLVLARYQAYLQAANPAEALVAFGRFRILCALRHGPYGVENLNRLVEEILAEAGLIDASEIFYADRPVMIVRNDYPLKLFNGDIGFIRRNENHGLRACFSGPDQTLREILPLRLPAHETAYAMTVHKSQGSEFEKVLLILPKDDSAVLTRELVYTGLTRASAEVELWAEPEIFTTSVRRQVSRRSGLREALWAKP